MKKTNAAVIWSVLGCFLILILIGVIVRGQQPPAPRPAHSDNALFSAMRAMTYLKVIAAAPHPTWSPENTKVRMYLLDILGKMGHHPIVQSAMLSSDELHPRAQRLTGHTIHNVMVRIPGQNSTGAIAVVSHYDSAPRSFGAADDGAAVAAMLETLRALRFLPRFRNDLIFLFTDAEEVGLHGAKKFVQKHHWFRDVKIVLNFEARGSYGPSLMFETNEQNGKIIAAFAKGDHAPRSTSLFYEVYRRLPNDTDFSVFKRAGVQGLNFAFIQGIRDYHQPTDHIKTLSLATLQDHGEHILSMLKTLGHTDISQPNAPNAVYFDVLGKFLLYYSQTTALLLTIAFTLLLGALLVVGWKRSTLRWTRILAGMATQLLTAALVGGLVGWIAWRFLSTYGHKLYAFYWDIPQDARYNVAFLCLSASLCFAVLALTQRWISRLEMAAAALVFWGIVTWIVLLVIPGASYLAFWPLAAGTLMFAGVLFLPHPSESPHFRRIGFWCLEIPLFLLTVPLFYHLPYALTLSLTGGFMALFALFFFLAFSSHDILMYAGRWWPSLAGLLAFLWLGFMSWLV